MRKSTFSEEQIAYTLRQAEARSAGEGDLPQVGISEQTFRLRARDFTQR